MPLGSEGFVIIDLPDVSPDILPSYDDCPVDEYMGNGTRFKRFSQYRLSPQGDQAWSFERLAHRDYTTYKKFNSVGGGIRRVYEPIKVDFTPLIEAGIRELGLDRSEDWQINVHQNRTRADGGKPGPLTPEGVHHDGHEFVMIAILNKVNVAGGTTRLWHEGPTSPSGRARSNRVRRSCWTTGRSPTTSPTCSPPTAARATGTSSSSRSRGGRRSGTARSTTPPRSPRSRPERRGAPGPS